MSVAWRAQRERGSRLATRFIIWVALALGGPAARSLLYPICLYYLLFSSQARRAIRGFLVVMLGRPVTWRDIFHQYHSFASTILDRVYLLRGRFDQFHVTVHGDELLDQYLTQGQGCILVGSHLGSFEIARAVGIARRSLEIKVLMHEENAPMIRDLMRELNPAVAGAVIPVGGLDSMLQVKESVDRGAAVGIMADRIVKDEPGVACKFFGKVARFPAGTMRLAGVVQAPIFLFFGLYRGRNRYDVHFELLADRIDLCRHAREQDIQDWTQRYVERLESYCRLAPDNWFNFYDFWADGG